LLNLDRPISGGGETQVSIPVRNKEKKKIPEKKGSCRGSLEEKRAAAGYKEEFSMGGRLAGIPKSAHRRRAVEDTKLHALNRGRVFFPIRGNDEMFCGGKRNSPREKEKRKKKREKGLSGGGKKKKRRSLRLSGGGAPSVAPSITRKKKGGEIAKRRQGGRAYLENPKTQEVHTGKRSSPGEEGGGAVARALAFTEEEKRGRA